MLYPHQPSRSPEHCLLGGPCRCRAQCQCPVGPPAASAADRKPNAPSPRAVVAPLWAADASAPPVSEPSLRDPKLEVRLPERLTEINDRCLPLYSVQTFDNWLRKRSTHA